MTIEEQIIDLETKFQTHPGLIPGTSITRVFREYGPGIEWCLSLGAMNTPKEYFNADTIEGCIEAAYQYIRDIENTKI